MHPRHLVLAHPQAAQRERERRRLSFFEANVQRKRLGLPRISVDENATAADYGLGRVRSTGLMSSEQLPLLLPATKVERQELQSTAAASSTRPTSEQGRRLSFSSGRRPWQPELEHGTSGAKGRGMRGRA